MDIEILSSKYVQVLLTTVLGKLASHQIEEFARNEFVANCHYRFVTNFQAAIDWVKESADKAS